MLHGPADDAQTAGCSATLPDDTLHSKVSMHCEHTVQMFNDPESLGREVAAFFHEGLTAGDNLMLVARPAHIEAIAGALAALGSPMSGLVDAARLTIADAETTLGAFMYNGRPSERLFDEVVGAAVRRLAAGQRRIRAYGEMVDILADEDNLQASEQLEDLWNDLMTRIPVHLRCGYRSANFVVPRTAHSLRAICGRHARVHTTESDLLANWLLAQHGCG